MITFQQNNDELVFGCPTTYMDSTLISFAAGDDGSNLVETTSFEPSLRRRIGRKSESSVKKIIHREVEKKRRQEMSALCASLGSLLPPTQIKGKLSVCDQIHVAVDHIKETEKKIERLRIRRDKLKKSLGLSNPKPSSSSAADHDCVTVNLGAEWVEILISTPALRLSRLLSVLAQRELDVVSCVSTRINGRFFHKIKIEALYMTSLDASELQDRLRAAIK